MVFQEVCLRAVQAISRLKALALLIIVLLLGPWQASANHLFGGELFYTHISGNTYKITMILYGDCGNTSGAFASLTTAQPAIEVYDGAALFQTLSLSAQPGSGVDVTPVCPDEANNTKCTN